MDLSATAAGTSAPASSTRSSAVRSRAVPLRVLIRMCQIHTGQYTETLISPGPTAGQVPDRTHRCVSRRDEKKDPSVSSGPPIMSSSGPLVEPAATSTLTTGGAGSSEEKTAKGEGERQGEDTGGEILDSLEARLAALDRLYPVFDAVKGKFQLQDVAGKLELQDEDYGRHDVLPLVDEVFSEIGGVSGVMKRVEAEYRASKDTPERLEQHRARMSFFQGSSDGPDLDPKFNPLYSIWESWACSVQFTHSEDLQLGLVHPEAKDGLCRRDLVIPLFSWAVPSRQVLEYMVKRAPDRKIVEVGAGTGYWARLLQKLGADVVAVDNRCEMFHHDRSYFPECKEVDGAEFLASGGADGRALFLCWPQTKRDNPAVSRFLDKYSGDTIFFVGEVQGATFCMLEWLEKHKAQGWSLEETFPIPTWPGLQDRFMCFSKVAAAGSLTGQSTDIDPCQSLVNDREQVLRDCIRTIS